MMRKNPERKVPKGAIVTYTYGEHEQIYNEQFSEVLVIGKHAMYFTCSNSLGITNTDDGLAFCLTLISSRQSTTVTATKST